MFNTNGKGLTRIKLHSRLQMLSFIKENVVQVDWSSEFFKRNKTLNAHLYAQQLQHVHASLHKEKMTQEKILKLVYSILLESPYLPDVTLIHHHIFLQNVLKGKSFFNENQIQDFVEILKSNLFILLKKMFLCVNVIFKLEFAFSW